MSRIISDWLVAPASAASCSGAIYGAKGADPIAHWRNSAVGAVSNTALHQENVRQPRGRGAFLMRPPLGQRLLTEGGLRIRPYIRAICDFFVTPAYAASRGADPLAYWRNSAVGAVSNTALHATGGGRIKNQPLHHVWLLVIARSPPFLHSARMQGGRRSNPNHAGTLAPGTLGSNTAAGQMPAPLEITSDQTLRTRFLTGWSRQGKIGGALECDGTDDYVRSIRNATIR